MRVRVRLRPARSTKPWRYFRRWRPAGRNLQIDGDDFLENRRRHGNAADAQALQESWGDAGGPEAALHLAGIGHTDALEGEDLLQIHLLILHPQHFTDGEDFTGSVLQAGNLHDELDGAGQLLEDDAGGNFEIGHHHHGFQAREGVAGCIGVHRAHGPLDAGLDFILTAGMKVGLVGPNGSGKTTLLRLLRGEFEPAAGAIRRADALRMVYFSQMRELDESLTLRRALAPEGDSIIHQGRVVHVASWAARFLFTGEQLNQPVRNLSGGERARVLIAKLMLEPADVLLLDEPTNDLDIPTLEILEENLLDFPGALVLVTHDRY